MALLIAENPWIWPCGLGNMAAVVIMYTLALAIIVTLASLLRKRPKFLFKSLVLCTKRV